MLKLNVLALLEEQGKTKYWLYKQLGMSYQNFNNMVQNRTKSIRYETLETMCQLLDCTPNDLFVIDWNEPEQARGGIRVVRFFINKNRKTGGCAGLFFSNRWDEKLIGEPSAMCRIPRFGQYNQYKGRCNG